jgi:hypothetical protein
MGRPLYCLKCTSRNSYHKTQYGNIRNVLGKIIQERWKCSVCGTEVLVIPDNMVESNWVMTPARQASLNKAREVMKKKRAETRQDIETTPQSGK